MFGIVEGNGTRELIQADRAELERIGARILRVRTYRAAKSILYYPSSFSDSTKEEIRIVESFSWKDSHRLQSLPDKISLRKAS